MSKLSEGLTRIAADLNDNIGWQTANHFQRQHVIDDEQASKLTNFELLESHNIKLSERQRYARREINRQIINSFTELELYELGVEIDDLGWQHDHNPA